MAVADIPDIVLIDKPRGITSFDVIRELRRRTGIKKWGHAGTLDPLATGLMILAHDAGTKKLHDLITLEKEYEAEILLGECRSTGDMEGVVLEERSVSAADISEVDILAALQSLVGTQTLPVSAYSAIKKDGVPMYKRARQAERSGVTIDDVPVRDMHVRSVQIGSIHPYIIDDIEKVVVSVRFTVGSGTYIRSLAEELGRRLGYPATLKNLRRTKVGEFVIEDAKQLRDLQT